MDEISNLLRIMFLFICFLTFVILIVPWNDIHISWLFLYLINNSSYITLKYTTWYKILEYKNSTLFYYTSMVSETIRLWTYPLFSSTEFDHEFIIVVISLRLSALDMGHWHIMLLFKSMKKNKVSLDQFKNWNKYDYQAIENSVTINILMNLYHKRLNYRHIDKREVVC